MGPARAAGIFLEKLSTVPESLKAVLYGSLAATAKGHLTEEAITRICSPFCVDIEYHPDTFHKVHPNSMDLIAFGSRGDVILKSRFYSVGGGELMDETASIIGDEMVSYPHDFFHDILELSEARSTPIWYYLNEHEKPNIWQYLEKIWGAMKKSVEEGLERSDPLPGELSLPRRAGAMLSYANDRVGSLRDRNLLSAYALAVSEQNASGGTIVTAPTCGSAGVVPSIAYFFWKHHDVDPERIYKALAVAGLIGSTVATRASVSGAQVGCQGEIGTACAMAAAAAAFLLKGSNFQIEYAAEMGLEHFLGLTCDPILGLVQVPCIERNAFAAMRAIDCAAYALATKGEHLISFDDVVDVMNETGRDLQEKYRETARGGLAAIMRDRMG